MRFDRTKIKWILILIMAVLSGNGVYGQTPDLVQMEYFFDLDPGYGNGTQVAFSPDTMVNISFNAELSSLDEGHHKFYIRFKDANGRWSLIHKQDVYKAPLPLNSSSQLPDVVAMEYYFDTDPGFGAGINVPVVAGVSVNKNFTADLSPISVGHHKLYIRVKDAGGRWSLIHKQDVYKAPLPSNPPGQLPDVVAIEYYFDTDPGFGAGINVPVVAGVSVNKNFTADLTPLSVGHHKLYVRVQDAGGRWSLIHKQDVYKAPLPSNPPGQLLDVVAMEYYFDTDPGFGAGINVPVVAGVSVNKNFTADLTLLSVGHHKLYVRVKDAGGRWSLIHKQDVYKAPLPSNPPGQLPNVVAMEYFYDLDPGFGQGIQVAVSPNPVVSVPLNLDLTVLGNGTHVLHTRVKDQTGRWSHNWQTDFSITCDFSDCTSPSNCGGSTYQDELYTAIQYLCQQNIVSGVNGSVLPNENITRAALAKIAFYGIYNGALNVPGNLPSDHFPSPYSDLQNPSTYYYRAAKSLLYLQYSDSITPFARNRANFFPGKSIKRIHTLKVLFEAFNLPVDHSGPSPFTDMTTTSEGYGYAKWAYDHGITTETTFDPNGTCLRAHAFLYLYRILQLINQNVVPVPQPLAHHFFLPGLNTPLTFESSRSTEKGNFSHYEKSSFNIAGRNVSLDFEHSYNSYLAELPADFFPVSPLGTGWSHTYNSYILHCKADSAVDDRWIAFWPDGTIHSYKKTGSFWNIETQGVYDTLIQDTPQKFRIVKKNKVTYTFEKSLSLNHEEVAWMFTGMSDRNGNAIQVQYSPGPDISYEGETRSTRKISLVVDPAGRTLSFGYSGSLANQLSSVTDPIGRTIAFSFSEGVVSEFSDAKNQATHYTYDIYSDGTPLLKEITLPKGNKVTNTYKNRKLISSKLNNRNPLTVNLDPSNYGNQASSEYLVSTVTDPVGVTTKYNYNSSGKTTKIYGNQSVNYDITYGNSAQTWLPSVVTDQKTGIAIDISYDSKGNPLHVHTSGDNISFWEQYEYNNFNDVTRYTNSRGHSTQYTYNSSGNLIKIQDPMNNITLIGRNAFGQITQITNPSGIATEYGYNNYGNQTSVEIPALNLLSILEYDDVSRLISETNFKGQTTTFEYDENDNQTLETNAMNYETGRAYDQNDNLTTILNAKNVPTTMTYDTLDRLSIVSFAGNSKAYTYYDDGTLHTYTDPNGQTITYQYDNSGRLISDGYATYSYEPGCGNLVAVSKDGKSIIYEYDGLNRISAITYSDVPGNTVRYYYDNNNNVVRITYPGNKNVYYSYDPGDRMTQVTDWQGASTLYSYRPDGQLLTMTYPNLVQCVYSYDSAGRMTGTEYRKNNGAGEIIASWQFTLDDLGNHLEEIVTEPFSNAINPPASLTNYTYDNGNRILTAGSSMFSYDNNGNNITKTGYQFHYDFRNNLTQVSGNYNASYEYDGLGNRRKKNQTRFILDILGMSKVLMETDQSGNPLNYYIYGMGLISRIKPTGQTGYYINDFRGSTVAVTDATADAGISHKYQYDDFGSTIQAQETDFNPFRYVGKYGVMYEDSALVFMRARYYDNTIGRFLSEDPVWGVNLYSYSDNNPLGKIDPAGRQSYNVPPQCEEFRNTPIRAQICIDESEGLFDSGLAIETAIFGAIAAVKIVVFKIGGYSVWYVYSKSGTLITTVKFAISVYKNPGDLKAAATKAIVELLVDKYLGKLLPGTKWNQNWKKAVPKILLNESVTSFVTDQIQTINDMISKKVNTAAQNYFSKNQ